MLEIQVLYIEIMTNHTSYHIADSISYQKSGRINNGMGGNTNQSSNTRYPPQLVELERLRRELAYRKQLNEQENNI